MRTAINPKTGDIFLVDFTDRGESDVQPSDALENLADTVSHIQNDYISKTELNTQIFQSPVEIKKQLDVATNDGESLQIGIDESRQAYIGSNIPLKFMNDVSFTKNPTSSSHESFSNIDNLSLITKNQFNEVINPLLNDVNDIMGDIAKIESVTQNGQEKHGIRADYAVQYGITDCPDGIIETSSISKRIIIKAGVRLRLPQIDNIIQIGSNTPYDIEEVGKITLFFTRTESSSGTIQIGFLEAGDVFYQEEEPSNGVTSFLAWWKPSLGVWQFKSNYTGNVWRQASATPIADINASSSGVISTHYYGYRIIDDDIFAQLSDIENIQHHIESILLRIENLEAKL